MARVIDRNEVRRLVDRESAQLVEVLPQEEYESEHIAGALNLPLPDLNAESAERLDRSRPVIAYCHDFQ
jgi:rhodanese-related sulfurtransferase